MKTLVAGLLAGLALLAADGDAGQSPTDRSKTRSMQLGSFSISLAVKDLEVSRDFYAKLGFEPVGGSVDQRYLILRNDTTLIGLFQGMFDRNILTFNPGWTHEQETLEDFEDVRALHERLTAQGLDTVQEAGLDGDGPGSFVLVDPDGNPILIDQHVPKPGS